jgi:hypothetical protein
VSDAQPYAAPVTATAPRPRTGLAVTALVLALVAAALCWLPFLGAVIALAGLVFGIVAWVQANSGRRGGKGMAVAATVVGLGALAMSVLLTVLLTGFFAAIVDCANPAYTEEQTNQCINDQLGR